MPVPSVNYPLFVPASQHKKDSDQGNQNGNGDDFDFDLLAEYLLDENSGQNMAFEFGDDKPAPTFTKQGDIGTVSPDQIFADPLADGTILLNQTKGQETYEHATTPQVNHVAYLPTAPTIPLISPPQAVPARAALVSAPPPPTVPTPTPLAPVNTLLAPSPAPLAPAPPNFAPSQDAPAPTVDPSRMVVHQHKRPRLEKQQPNAPPVHGNVQMVQQILAPRAGRQKSQAQIDRRRERNRILARRTRLRKKFFFESLQKEVTDLQKENVALKQIVRSKIAAKDAKPILAECKAMEEIPSVVMEQCGDPSLLGRQDFNLVQSVQSSQQSFVITDPSLQDNPIVYASDDFLKLTGYAREEVLGRNCRFLQGSETSLSKVAEIQKAIASGSDIAVTFVNYKADGTPFWNKLFIAALRDAQNNIVNFIGVIVKVASPDADDPEAGKKLPGETSFEDDNGEQKSENTVDADAAVMAIEGAVTAAVAAAPMAVKTSTIKPEP